MSRATHDSSQDAPHGACSGAREIGGLDGALFGEQVYTLKHDRGFWPNQRIALALLLGACVFSTAQAAVVSGLLGAPPTTIEIRAEPIPAFDPHHPSRQRFGQLEFRGGVPLKS